MWQMMTGVVLTALAVVLFAPTCGGDPGSVEASGGRVLAVVLGVFGVGFVVHGFQHRTEPARKPRVVDGTLEDRTPSERLAMMVGRPEGASRRRRRWASCGTRRA